MRTQMLGLVIGGLIPAVCFGISGIFQKTSARAGIGTGPYLMIVGAVVLAMGLLLTLIQQDPTVNRESAKHTAAYGVLWAIGIASISFALSKYQAQISQLVPLYNMNTLVAVLLGLVVLGEWRDVQLGRLLAASVLTILGGILAATSSR